MPNITADLFGEVQATDRLFFALFPDPEVLSRIAGVAEDLRRTHGLKRSVHPLEHLHITLFHLGDYAGLPRDLVLDAMAAAEALNVAPFEVTFDHATSFPGRPNSRPFVLKGTVEAMADLTKCRRDLGVALAGEGVKTTAAFTPHLTLFYDNPIVEPCPITPISWSVCDLVLIRSTIGKGTYERIGRWPLEH